jgi:hypothetical protein
MRLASPSTPALRRAGRRALLAASAALLGAAAAPALPAQSLAQRAGAVRDGEVRLAYAARSGACGDGRDVVALGGTLFVYPNMESHGRWSGVRCEAGPARVSLTVRGGAIDAVRTRVGGAWGPGDGAVTDLGRVSAAEAAAYLLAVAERVEGRAARQALLGAVVADSADVRPGLLRIARDARLARETRRRATGWLGEVGDASLVGPLAELARGDADGSGVGSAAVYALSRLPDDAGVPALIAFARSAAPVKERKEAVFWLGHSENRRARETVRAIALDTGAAAEVRSNAIFALGHGGAATAEDFAFLQRLFPTLGERRLQDQVLMAVAQRGGAAGRRWALDRARDASLPRNAREQALFWAEQGGVPTAELIAAWDALDDRRLKDHGLFVLSQRDEPAARDKLLAVARADGDRQLRKTALFWLTQRRDPRAERLVRELLER